jgi:hypothetical protein
MTPSLRNNVGHSIFERLKKQARVRREDFSFVLQRFAVERWLYRLGISRHRKSFILKGASLIHAWLERDYRATRDVDLLGLGPSDVAHIRAVFRELCSIEPQIADGVVFDSSSLAIQPIREGQEYGGERVTLKATLHSAGFSLQIDLAFGDAVTPRPVPIEYPTRLGLPAPMVLAYPKESLVAEKLEAMVSLGMANSRMKDFYDVWLLSRKTEFDGAILRKAILATFKRRRTALPQGAPVALTNEFANDPQKQSQWQAFVTKVAAEEAPGALSDAVSVIGMFLKPLLTSIAEHKEFRGTWETDAGWTSSRLPGA